MKITKESLSITESSIDTSPIYQALWWLAKG